MLMTTISGTALTGLYQATQKLARAARDVADSPNTGGDTTKALLDAKLSVFEYRANAKVLQLEKAREKELYDILA